MRHRTASLVAWSLWAVAVLLDVAALWVGGQYRSVARLVGDAAVSVAFLAFGVAGALIVSRRQGRAIGWVFVAISSGGAAQFLATEYAAYALRVDALPGLPWAIWFGSWAWAIPFGMTATLLLLLFPDGRLPSRRWRPFAYYLAALAGLVVGGFALGRPAFWAGTVPNPVHVPFLEFIFRFANGPGLPLFLAAVVGSVVSLVVRFRRADRTPRQQIKWFVLGAAFVGATFLLTSLFQLVGVDDTLAFRLIDSYLGALGLLVMATGAGIGILKYRLYDIDVVINRAVLFGLLAAIISAVYVGIVVGIGALVGSRGNLLLSILATAIIAVLFQPIRARAGHFANRLVYGKRATPYEVLSEFSDRVGGSYAADDVLPRMARVVAEGTGASRADVWVRVGTELRHAAAWPSMNGRGSLPLHGERLPEIPESDRAFPIRDADELLGALSVAKSPREPLTPAEDKLVADLASQAGLILRNVRLIEELRASRQRLVTAQDAERRRLERNIHDGAQQQLVALAVRLRLAQNMAGKEAPKVADLLDGIRGETQEALENLRDLARGIYPPLLADKGLTVALEAQARKAPVPVEVESDGIGRYPQEAEAAVYFCVLEALQNVAKYAAASNASVRLAEEDGHLVFSVTDDGAGFSTEATPKGAGLQNMADRLDALGGSIEVDSSPGVGTTVTGRIPVAGGR